MPKVLHTIIRYNELSSTNDKCMELSKEDSLKPYTIILADNQTNGKGQNGNKWHSKKNQNLTFSLYIPHNKLLVENQFCLNKAIAIGLNEAIIFLTNSKSKIKWPNDILVNGEKVAGILIENIVHGKYLSKSIVGIGINVNQTEFSQEYGDPTSLFLETGHKHIIEEVLNIVIEKLLLQIEHLNTKNFTIINDSYDANLYKKEEICTFETKQGIMQAKLEKVNNLGALVVSNSTGIYTKMHGEIKLIKQ